MAGINLERQRSGEVTGVHHKVAGRLSALHCPISLALGGTQLHGACGRTCHCRLMLISRCKSPPALHLAARLSGGGSGACWVSGGGPARSWPLIFCAVQPAAGCAPGACAQQMCGAGLCGQPAGADCPAPSEEGTGEEGAGRK